MMRPFALFLGVVTIAAMLCAAGHAAKANDAPPFQWRNIGPADYGGHVNDLAVPLPRTNDDPSAGTVIYAGAPGGLFKSSDAGVTWTSLFDKEPVAAINAVAVAPSNPDVVWAGTGFPDIYHMGVVGDGVYKSTDGGTSWTAMGLRPTQFTGKILIDPRNPDTVLVGAIGPLGAPSRDRGLYRSDDGGRTWQQTLYINDRTGIVDLAAAPDDPSTVYASAEQIAVAPWPEMYIDYGPGSGIFKSTDGGKTWRRLEHGLPRAMFGYCSIGVSAAKPNIVYVLAQTVLPASPQALERTKAIALYRSDDYGENWSEVASSKTLAKAAVFYRNDLGRIAVDPTNADHVFITSLRVLASSDGGKHFKEVTAPEMRTFFTYRLPAAGISADQHVLWIDPNDPRHLIAGNDHGIFISRSSGATWRHVETLNLQQYFSVAADRRRPFYHVFGSMRDNNGYGGPSAGRLANGIENSEWSPDPAAESFGTAADSIDNRTIYVGAGSGLARFDTIARDGVGIGPFPAYKHKQFSFNIDGPVVISPIDHRTIFTGTRSVWVTHDRGDHWREISGPLSPRRSRTLSLGGVREDVYEYGGLVDGGITPTTITTIAQSPRDGLRIFAGTQDGRLAFTRDGGRHWRSIAHMPGTPSDATVSRVTASARSAAVAYAAYQAVNNADYRPYLFRTLDGGEHWTPIVAGLPSNAAVYGLAEDPHNVRLLFAGTEVGVFYSTDAGTHWHSLRLNMPAAWVRDLVVQPDTRGLVAASWGRGLWILDDVNWLENDAVARSASWPTLLAPHDAVSFRQEVMGPDEIPHFGEPNPPYGVLLTYYVPSGATLPKQFSVVIEDQDRQRIRSIAASAAPGWHRVVWDLRYTPPVVQGPPGPRVFEGRFRARLSTSAKTVAFSVLPDPDSPLTGPQRAELFQSMMRDYSLMIATNEAVQRAKSLLATVKKVRAVAKTPADRRLKSVENGLQQILANLGEVNPLGIDSSAPPSVTQTLLTMGFDEEYYPRVPAVVRNQRLDEAARDLRAQRARLDRVRRRWYAISGAI